MSNQITVEVELVNRADVQPADAAKLKPVRSNGAPPVQSNNNHAPRSSVQLSSNDIVIENTPSSNTLPPKDAGEYRDSILQLAATLVKNAKLNRYLPFKSDPKSVRLYRAYYHPVFVWTQHLVVLMILALAMFEDPSIWPDSTPYYVCQVVEIFCLGYLVMRVIHLATFQHKTDFWKDKKNIVAIALIVLSVIDIISYTIWRGPAFGSTHAIRWSRPLRPFFFVNFPHARQIRRAFRNIRRTLVEIIFVLILFSLSVLLFSFLAFKLFGKQGLKTRFGEPYFASYPDSLWNLYVLVTTANNPDVMMPAYDYNPFSAIFFIIFLIINLYIFMNVLLAVIFNSYKKHLKNEVKASVFAKRRILADAYDLVKVKTPNGSGYCLTVETWRQLMKYISSKTGPQQVDMLFQVMDNDSDGKITKAEFLNAADLLNVPLTEVKDRIIIWERLCRPLFTHRASQGLRMVVKSKWFRYFFDLAIAVNAICIAWEQQDAEWFFLALFTLEIILKLYSYGPKRFFRTFWNLFDLIIIGGALIITVIEATRNESNLEQDTLDFLLVLRVLRLVKLVNGIERFHIVITTLVNIGPSMAIYGGVVMIIYYFFAIIGMEVFQYKIQYYGNATYTESTDHPFCGNPKLNGSEFFEVRYCSNNFNSIASALVVLAELTVVNQWHVLTSGFELVTHKAVKIYFIAFHLSVVVLIMNIFIAFILEAFILEYSFSKSKFESSLEAKILQLGYGLGQKKDEKKKSKKSDKATILDKMESIEEEEDDCDGNKDEGIRFHVKNSQRQVEVLLQRMFEDDLDPEDMGSNADLEVDPPSRKFTFEQVMVH